MNETSSEKLWMHISYRNKNNINEININWWKNELYDFNIDGNQKIDMNILKKLLHYIWL